MRMMNLRETNKKKVRGARRKCDTMVKSIIEDTLVFPEIDMKRGYWHTHLPVSQVFIDSKKTPSKVRTLCMQTLIDRALELIRNKPKLDEKARVVVCITLPSLWDSQLIVFFGDEYYGEFFDRDSSNQRWTPLEPDRSIEKELNLSIPKEMAVKGYDENISFEDETRGIVIHRKSEIWFIGELY